MKAKKLEIQLSRCLLILTERELMQCLTLKPEIFEAAIGRGKGKLRAESRKRRQLKYNARGFDRWNLYEILKSNEKVDNEIVQWIQGMDVNELREGIIEWLLVRNRNTS